MSQTQVLTNTMLSIKIERIKMTGEIPDSTDSH